MYKCTHIATTGAGAEWAGWWVCSGFDLADAIIAAGTKAHYNTTKSKGLLTQNKPAVSCELHNPRHHPQIARAARHTKQHKTLRDIIRFEQNFRGW